jgi:hypothetical protein
MLSVEVDGVQRHDLLALKIEADASGKPVVAHLSLMVFSLDVDAELMVNEHKVGV